jgi:hypothetical protein
MVTYGDRGHPVWLPVALLFARGTIEGRDEVRVGVYAFQRHPVRWLGYWRSLMLSEFEGFPRARWGWWSRGCSDGA